MKSETIITAVVGSTTAVFAYLKLTGQISWSWVWVLSPVWILLFVILLAIAGVAALIHYYGCRSNKN